MSCDPYCAGSRSFTAGAGSLTDSAIAVMVVMVLLSAVTTEVLGLHLLFGSFLAGAVMPRIQNSSATFSTRLRLILVAIADKLGGSMTVAQGSGGHWREAAGLGILMNTRGLVELVILNIGVSSPALFSKLVLTALVATFMTTSLLEAVYPMHLIRKETLELNPEEAMAYEPA